MSEYWKSTPTYWCKFCETYVRDTPISKQQHEATGKHQGAIQRSLRKLHKDQEIEEREKQRAKDEVARLKGVVSGNPKASTAPGDTPRLASSKSELPKQATAEDRKKQLKQLADMGVAIPEEFRKDMAMASEWQTVSTRQLDEDGKIKEEKGDFKSFGVHKRKADDAEDSEDDVAGGLSTPHRGTWGTRVKTHGSSNSTALDFDSLLRRPRTGSTKAESADGPSNVKKEEDEDLKQGMIPVEAEPVKDAPDVEHNSTPVIFKKRKTKPMKA